MTAGSEHEIPTQVGSLLIKRKTDSGLLPAGCRQLCSSELLLLQDLPSDLLGGGGDGLGTTNLISLWARP